MATEVLYKFIFNDKIGRWDVDKRDPDGSELVMRDYATPGEARALLESLTGKQLRPSEESGPKKKP
jgi:hypothetical protein